MTTPQASTLTPRFVAQLLTVAIVLWGGCSDSEAAPNKKISGAGSGSLAVATKYYEDNLTKCGDSHIANWTFSDGSGSRLVELKGVRYSTSPIPITQADRLNGLEEAFESWIQPTAARRTASPSDDWEPWRDEKSVFRFRFLKVNGNWSVTPVYTGGISGFLTKYPCNELPGNPARLAREEAERRLAAQARQVGAVSFTCGPVRDYSGYGTQTISVTDASVRGIDGLPHSSVAFIDARYFSKFDKDNLDGPGIWLSGTRPYNRLGEWGFRFRGPSAEANRDACYQAIAASYEHWRTRFPTLAKLPDLQAELHAGAARQQLREEAARQREEQLRADTLKLEGTDCGTESASILVLGGEKREFVVSPNRECWTPWLVIAEGQEFGGTTESGGNVLMDVEFIDGTTREPFEDGPHTNIRLRKQVRKARFKSLGREPVTVTFRVR